MYKIIIGVEVEKRRDITNTLRDILTQDDCNNWKFKCNLKLVYDN